MKAQELVELRRRLMMTGYAPIPIIDRSKRPAIEKGWQTHLETNEAEIELWSRVYPGASGTGLLCGSCPRSTSTSSIPKPPRRSRCWCGRGSKNRAACWCGSGNRRSGRFCSAPPCRSRKLRPA